LTDSVGSAGSVDAAGAADAGAADDPDDDLVDPADDRAETATDADELTRSGAPHPRTAMDVDRLARRTPVGTLA
jgi:hypothetical protein